MNRILRLVLTVATVFFVRVIYGSLVSGSPGGASAGATPAQPQQPGWITQKLAGLLQNTTGTALSPRHMRSLSVLILLYSFVLGLVVHLILGDRAFGRTLNGLIALLGAAAAIVCLGFLSPGMGEDGLGWMAAATIFSSFLFIGVAVAMKAFILSEAEDFAIGNQTRTGGAMKALTGGAPRSPVSQDRIQRALRRS
ncbi:MAG TPA: hypothetical protein VKS78_08485 [Roseiarcus sp.]|nr:hypothetical protein [Roseiarcus sp.]